MSTHSNFKKDKCWSCEFFSAHRKLESGFIFGDSVHTDTNGTCCNSRSTDNGRTVNEEHWCSKYQKWSLLASKLAIEEQKKESERIIREQKLASQRIQESTVERTSSYTAPSRKVDFVKKEKEEAEYKKQRKINLKKSEIAKENRRPTIVLIIGLLISGIAFLLGWAPYWVFNSKLQAVKDSITFLYNMGHDVNEPLMVELYEQGLQYKASRDSIVWLPFVILSIALVATIIIMVIASKKKPARMLALRRELDELTK